MGKGWQLDGLVFTKGRVNMNFAGEIVSIDWAPDPEESMPGFMRIDPLTETERQYHRPEGREVVQRFAGKVTGVEGRTVYLSLRDDEGRYDYGEIPLSRGETAPDEGDEFVIIVHQGPEGDMRTWYGTRMPCGFRDVNLPEIPTRGELEKLVGKDERVIGGMSCVVARAYEDSMDLLCVNEQGNYFQGKMPKDMLREEPKPGTEFYLPTFKRKGESGIIQKAYPKEK